jgi:hypothetical protein
MIVLSFDTIIIPAGTEHFVAEAKATRFGQLDEELQSRKSIWNLRGNDPRQMLQEMLESVSPNGQRL